MKRNIIVGDLGKSAYLILKYEWWMKHISEKGIIITLSWLVKEQGTWKHTLKTTIFWFLKSN